MTQQFIFLVGLPGSGKSTWLKDNSEGFEVVSADKIKEDNYKNPKVRLISRMNWDFNFFCEEFHEESVKLAEEDVYKFIRQEENVILDGGGINRSYNLRIINIIKDINPDIEIKGIYFDTPIEVCLDRISQRDRKVPTDEVYKKSQMLPACLNRYRSENIDIETVNYFTDKYVFFDLDGTLCAINDPVYDEDGNIDFVNTEFFLHSKPLDTLDYYHKCVKEGKEVFILTAAPNSIALIDKRRWANKWLSNYIQMFNDGRFMWVGNKDYKHVFLKQYLLGKKIDPKDVLYIDDTMQTINKMRSIGVHAKHVSQL